MFYLLTYTMHLFRIIAVVFKGSLCDNFSTIKCLINPMDSNTIHLHTILHSSLYRSCAHKGWKQ